MPSAEIHGLFTTLRDPVARSIATTIYLTFFELFASGVSAVVALASANVCRC